jgi:hypothetical protein
MVQGALRRPVLWETIILALLCVVDTFFTVLLLRLGIAVEANPLLAPFAALGAAPFVLAKSVSFLPPLALLEVLRPLRPGFIQFSLRVGIFGYIAVYIVGSLQIHGLL